MGGPPSLPANLQVDRDALCRSASSGQFWLRLGCRFFRGLPNFAGQRFAGRLANDPLNQLTLRELNLVDGEGSQTTSRTTTEHWEDYSQTGVDPSDDCTIWYVGDFFKKDATAYSTRIAGVRLPGCR